MPETTPSDFDSRFGGIARLYSTEGLRKLAAAHVCVVGVGGVGSWVVEALARSGIGRLTLVDADDVCVTNVNRQVPAVDGEFGRPKVEAMTRRIRLIAPACMVVSVPRFFTATSADDILQTPFDQVVDAIDSLGNKALLTAECARRRLPLIVSGGAGGRRDPTRIRVDDLSRTSHDPLLLALRRTLRREHGFPTDQRMPFGVPCVYTDELPLYPAPDGTVCATNPNPAGLRMDCSGGFGSASFVTGAVGFAIVARVVSRIAGREPV